MRNRAEGYQKVTLSYFFEVEYNISLGIGNRLAAGNIEWEDFHLIPNRMRLQFPIYLR